MNGVVMKIDKLVNLNAPSEVSAFFSCDETYAITVMRHLL